MHSATMNKIKVKFNIVHTAYRYSSMSVMHRTRMQFAK